MVAPTMPSLPVVIGSLLASAGVIYVACEFFVNGVEWVGRKLAVGQKATGTILAAFGTALPESVVTLVAVAFGTRAADKDIGIGAAMGGPLVLGSLAYAVVGIAMLACRRALPTGGEAAKLYAGLSRDQGWFVLISALKLGLGLAAFALKSWLGFLFLAAYGAYAWQEIGADQEGGDHDLDPLRLTPSAATPTTLAALAQTLIALGVIFAASRLFVANVAALGPYLGLAPQLRSLLVSPIATELPETLNAIIWVRQGKVRLALANISGAMMIQATVPTAFGLFWSPWRLDRPVIVAGAITLLAVTTLFIAFRRGRITRTYLAAMSLSYVAFGLMAGLAPS
jgi:cation:H+ antiporter